VTRKLSLCVFVRRSILSPEWKADKTRVDKVRYWTAVARLFGRNRFVQVESAEEAGSMEEAGSGHEDLANILTLDALFCSRVPGTPELPMSMRIRPICKSSHTYIRTDIP
jgi:hypothetical protein